MEGDGRINQVTAEGLWELFVPYPILLWTWANSRRLWEIGRPGVLQSMGSQTVGHNWATELRSNRREIRQAYFPSFMIIIYSFRIPSSSFWVLYWYHGTDERNRESTWISIQIMQFALQGLLAIESQFWKIPPPSRLLLLQLWLLDYLNTNHSCLSPWPSVLPGKT